MKQSSDSVYVVLKPLIDSVCQLEVQPLSSWNAQNLEVPRSPGVYVIYRDRTPIYVGETANLNRRILINHRRGQNSAFWDKLRKEDPSRTDSDIRDMVSQRCAFRFVRLQEGTLSYETRRRLEAFFQAVYNPKLNFLPVRETNKKRKELLERIDLASQGGDFQTVKAIAEELPRRRREFLG